jgi:hypothetical protein
VFYLDGAKVSSQAASGSINNGGQSLNIGNDPAGLAEPFTGSIDDVRIYNRALNAAEIQQLYKLGAANVGHSNAGAIGSGLVGY